LYDAIGANKVLDDHALLKNVQNSKIGPKTLDNRPLQINQTKKNLHRALVHSTFGNKQENQRYKKMRDKANQL